METFSFETVQKFGNMEAIEAQHFRIECWNGNAAFLYFPRHFKRSKGLKTCELNLKALNCIEPFGAIEAERVSQWQRCTLKFKHLPRHYKRYKF